MNQFAVLRPSRRDEVLVEAAERNVTATLSVKGAKSWTVHKSRILHASVGQTLVVEYPLPAPGHNAPPQIVPGQNLSVAFRRGHKKVIFAVPVLARGQTALNAELTVRSLTLLWPEQVQEMQRRAYYRASVPRNRSVRVEMWQGTIEDRERVQGGAWRSYKGELTDLSAGGVGVRVTKDQDPAFREGDPVALTFQVDSEGPRFVLDAVFRHSTKTPEGLMALGLQFVGLDATVEGRRTLHQLMHVVGRFQRYELRQAKLQATME
jgi:c-di-GMP-binding flagellar brake protein YcgR